MTTSTLTLRQINTRLRASMPGVTLRVSPVGSLWALRIEDAAMLPVGPVLSLVATVGMLLQEQGMTDSPHALCSGMNNSGFVANWAAK